MFRASLVLALTMDRATGEIVLLTGSSGFLGSRVLKYLLEDAGVSEIRALDKLVPPNRELNSKQILKSYHCDLLDLESCREAFRGADVVLHCAGLVSYNYPPDVDGLQKNNVEATENVVKLCIEESVGRLVHCSTTEVTLQSYSRGGIVAISIYKQDCKLEPPENHRRLIFGEYAGSKLRAERIVLSHNGSALKNGKDRLRAVALRPTLLFGEGDPHLVPKILRLAKSRGNYLPRLVGDGKQQMTYVGNAAWAFLKAKDVLRKRPKGIAGYPVSITDDTIVDDLTQFCEKITRNSSNHVRVFSWPMPLFLSYVAAVLFELLSDFGIVSKFQIPPRSIVAYVGSIILYNRARASIHMDYWPKYKHEQTLALASKYYGKVCNEK